MARRAPADYGVEDTVYIDYGYDENGGADPEPEDPIPGWRKPIALAGWGLLIAVLIGLIVWGIMQLVQGGPPQEPATVTTTPRTTPRTTQPPSSAPPTLQRTPEETTTRPTADIPTASTENSGTATTTSPSTPLPGAFPLPQLPSVITLPALPGLPSEITLPTLPPGL
jgi:hypothetical protein